MSQTRVLALLAGAALSIGAPALAQNANLDNDRAFAAELAADAGNRSSLQGGGSAGWDGKGFMITDGGGNTLYVGGDAQFRYFMNFRDEDSVGSNDDFTHGFTNGDVRLRTWGSIWSKELTYKVQGNFGGDGGFTLEDAFGTYTFENGAYVTWGQFKAPLLWEDLVDDVYQLAMDRSLTSQIFGGGRTQGVAIGYQAEQFRIVGSFNDGARTDNTFYTSDSEADYALTARGEFMWAGSWEQFNDFTSFRSSSEDLAGKVGAAVHWQDGGETGGTVDASLFVLTADVALEGKGWNAFAAIVWDSFEPEGGDNTDNFAAVVQGGIFLADQVEIFGRFDAIWLDDDLGGDDEDSYFLTVGVNYYVSPESHAAKFTAEFGWAFNETEEIVGAGGLVGNSDGTGFLGQTEDNEIYFGAQMQVLY